jgi:hypothetical protein
MLRLLCLALAIAMSAGLAPARAEVKLFNPNLAAPTNQPSGLKSLSKPCLLQDEHYLECSLGTIYACTKKVVGSGSSCHFETSCAPAAMQFPGGCRGAPGGASP